MNYEDERYVRLFVRDTGTWASWRWEARAILPLLMRKLDRDGRLEWPPGDDACSLAALLMMPVKVVAPGLRELARTQTINLGDGWLVMPNFPLGQNVKSKAKTSAERTEEWKRKTGYKHGRETAGDEASPPETPEPLYCAVPVPQPSSATSLRSDHAHAREGEQPVNDLLGEEPPALIAAIYAKPAETPKRRGKPRATVDDQFALDCFASFGAARCELTGREPRALTDEMRDQLAKLVAAAQPTIDDWRAVVLHRLAMDRRGEGYGSLTWASLTAPKNFERWLLEAQRKPAFRPKTNSRAEPSSKPTIGGVVDLRSRLAGSAEEP